MNALRNGRHVQSGHCMMGPPGCSAGWDGGLRCTVLRRVRRGGRGWPRRELGRMETNAEYDGSAARTRLVYL